MANPANVRKEFEVRVKKGIPNPPGEFHPLDLERVKDDRYLNRILTHVDNDLKRASDMLWNLMLWRKTVGANEINENTIRIDYVKEGTFFPRGRDIDGCLLFIVKCKKYIKGQNDFGEIKKVLIYWLDRIEREENGKLITLFFDVDGSGLGNMDLELVKYLIDMFNLYYPYLLNYIIIFQMPWILSAAFKVVKSMLPAKASDLMKFCSKDNLHKVVAPEQALTCWGGKDSYEFEFVPESRSFTDDLKKVTFADQDDNHSTSDMLRLNPHDKLTFKNHNNELSSEFTITNNSENAVSFKIRTTAPEKFRVRPSFGTLRSGSAQTVLIVVQPGFQSLIVTKDRFLVVAVEIPKTDLTPKELAEVWQNSAGRKVDEYRLKCQSPENILDYGTDFEDNTKIDIYDSVLNAVNNLQTNLEFLNRDVRKVEMFQFLTLFMTTVVILLIYFVYIYTN